MNAVWLGKSITVQRILYLRNPLLPHLPKKPTRWKAGPTKGTFGIPALQADRFPPTPPGLANGYKKSNCGRKPKQPEPVSVAPCPPDPRQVAMWARRNGEAGDMPVEWGHFLFNSSLHWGSNLDMLSIAHGAVGCGAFGLTQRLHLPGFVQGIESFTALDACTDL